MSLGHTMVMLILYLREGDLSSETPRVVMTDRARNRDS